MADPGSSAHDGRPKRLGVLGGGQLGRMLAEAAHRLGVQVHVLDPTPNCPAAQVGALQTVGSFRDGERIRQLASHCDVLTVEIEHVDVDALDAVAAAGLCKVHPPASALRTVADKFAQKQFLTAAGAPAGEYAEVRTPADVAQLGQRWGFPLMLKRRRLAYDGRGNAVVRSTDDVAAAWQFLGGSGAPEQAAQEAGMMYAERWVPYAAELAVMVVRGAQGETRAYPPLRTWQKDSMCVAVEVPAPGVTRATLLEAERVAALCAQALQIVGVIGVELFALADGRVLLNEVAPRPHNSGHLTIEACDSSQFEQHVRAVLGMPLGSTALAVPFARMVNVVGGAEGEVAAAGSDDVLRADAHPVVARSLLLDGAHVHWYGKASRPARKLGHVTVVAPSRATLLARCALAEGAATQGGAESQGGGQVTEGAGAGDAPRAPSVSVIMGSDSDLPTMRDALQVLRQFGVSFEVTIVSAHRTPERMVQFGRTAHKRGIKVIIAAAGGAAHLPGMVAALTPLPVIGVPVPLKHLDGVDSLHSIVQMPRGVPCATVAIGNSTNAALLAVRILSVADATLIEKMEAYQAAMERTVLEKAAALEESELAM